MAKTKGGYFLTFGEMDERANVAPGSRQTFGSQAKAKEKAQAWLKRGQKRVCIRQELPSGRTRPVTCVGRVPSKKALGGCGCGG